MEDELSIILQYVTHKMFRRALLNTRFVSITCSRRLLVELILTKKFKGATSNQNSFYSAR